jgi:DNA repair ATPase RecN
VIEKRRDDVSSNKENFDNYLQTITEFREELALELQTLDGRCAGDEKIETLKRQLERLKSELSRRVGALVDWDWIRLNFPTEHMHQ